MSKTNTTSLTSSQTITSSSNTNEVLLAQTFDRALSAARNHIRSKFHFDLATCEALAALGVEYAANYYLRVRPVEVLSLEKLVGLAAWSAGNRAKDVLRHQKKHPELLVLDDNDFEEDGETVAESHVLRAEAMRRWREKRRHDDRQELGAYALGRLEEMFDLLKLNPLRRQVFRAVYLEGECLKDVCARHHIKPNYAYGIVFGVKAKLAQVGPAFLTAA